MHRDWHLADSLEDVTDRHTSSYNREAAAAFAYGFIFNTIKISRSGVVRIGALNDAHFKGLDESGIIEFSFLDGAGHADAGKKVDWPVEDSSKDNSSKDNSSKDNSSKHNSSKRDILNTILVKTFELLATTHRVRDAICAHAKSKLGDYIINKDPQFIRQCLEDEFVDEYDDKEQKNVKISYYNSILNLFDGYFRGTKSLPYNEQDRAKKNTGYMFTLVLEEIFNMCKLFSGDAATIKTTYEKMVDLLYDDAGFDNAQSKTKSTSLDQLDEVEKIIALAIKSDNAGEEHLFADEQPYSRKNAKEMINYFLNK